MSRRRRQKRRREHDHRRTPYENLVRGIQSDDRLQRLYERALWSFFCAPFPPHDDAEAQERAMARAFEWFLFDLVLPDSGRTPAQEWIERQADQHAWSNDVIARYTRFTAAEFGLFEVTAPGAPMLLKHVQSGRVVYALDEDGWLTPSQGDVLAARLFPLGQPAFEDGHPILQLSPGSDIVPPASRSRVRKLADADAIRVETLFGASPEWIAEGAGTRELPMLADHFLHLLTGDGAHVTDLENDLRECDDPGPVVAQLLTEVTPLISQEVALLTALVASLWVQDRYRAGATAAELNKLTRAWSKKVIAASRSGEHTISFRLCELEAKSDPAFQVSEHEIARLRFLPVADRVEWVGRRQRIRVPIRSPGQLPEYPDAIVWMEEPSGLMVGSSIVSHNEQPAILLRTLLDAMSNPGASAGSPRRPASVRVQSRAIASRMRAALAPLGIQIGVRYSEPDLAELLRRYEHHARREEGHDRDDFEAGFYAEGYLTLPGSTPDRVADFFAAAERFYRAAPWTVLDDSRWIHMRVPGFSSSLKPSPAGETLSATAVVMGHGKQTFGLALYFDPVELECTQLGAHPQEGLHYDTLSVTFDDERDTSAGVIAEIRNHRWPVAGRRAYPCGLRTAPDEPPRLIAGHELDLARAVLDAVREFVGRHADRLGDTRADVMDKVDVDGIGAVKLALRSFD